MSDIIRIASKYRERLRTELAKVDDFLRMSEALTKLGEQDTAIALGPDLAKMSGPRVPPPAPAAPATQRIAEDARIAGAMELTTPKDVAAGRGLSFRNASQPGELDRSRIVA